MENKPITFKEFKQIIFDYFKEHYFLNKHQLKRYWKVKFKLEDKTLVFYSMTFKPFKFSRAKLTLNYRYEWWILKKDEEVLSSARYIWKCCHFLNDPRIDYYINKEKN